MSEGSKKNWALLGFSLMLGVAGLCVMVGWVLLREVTPDQLKTPASREDVVAARISMMENADSPREFAMESWSFAQEFTKSNQAKTLQVQFALAPIPSRWSNILCAEKVDDPNTRGILVTSAFNALPWKAAKDAEVLKLASMPGGKMETELLEIETVIHDHVAKLSFRLKEQ